MIRKEGLRHRSYYLESEYDQSIKEELETLDESEREFLANMFDPSFAEEMVSIEYKQVPVDMYTFLTDKYYLGNVGKTLYPKLMDDLIELFSGEYHEAILGGAIGSGKTTVGHIAIIRMLYEASCLNNPQASYGIMDGTPICFANVGVNKTNAEKVVFEGVLSKLQLSEYFKKDFKPINASKKELMFIDNIQVLPGSSSETGVIGMNIFGAIMDETNFMDRGRRSVPQAASHARWGQPGNAQTLYTAIHRRMKSRFMRQGKLPGILMLLSSKQTVNDFTNKRIMEAMNDPHIFVRDHSQWGVKDRKFFSPKTFKVLIGNDKIRSKILSPDEVVNYDDAESGNGENGPHVIDIPDDFRADFEGDLENAIRDIAGIATMAISNFLQKREKIFEMINRSRSHPFSVMSYDMSKPGGFIWEKICTKIYDQFDKNLFEWVPLLNPHSVRYAHIDPSLNNDATGICVGHISHTTEVIRRRKDSDGSDIMYKETAPFIVIDFILQIVPPIGEEIVLGDVRQLIYDMSAHGFPIRLVTLDSYQSADGIQQFKNKGYRSKVLSMDVSPEPYDNAKLALYENRVDCYPYELLTDELKCLEKDAATGKVDHRATSTKDLSDSFAGVIHTLTTMMQYPVPPMERGISERPVKDDQDEDWLLHGRHAKVDKSGNDVAMPLPFLRG